MHLGGDATLSTGQAASVHGASPGGDTHGPGEARKPSCAGLRHGSAGPPARTPGRGEESERVATPTLLRTKTVSGLVGKTRKSAPRSSVPLNLNEPCPREPVFYREPRTSWF